MAAQHCDSLLTECSSVVRQPALLWQRMQHITHCSMAFCVPTTANNSVHGGAPLPGGWEPGLWIERETHQLGEGRGAVGCARAAGISCAHCGRQERNIRAGAGVCRRQLACSAEGKLPDI